MTEDEQEARSIRFAAPLRLVKLTSGRWGVFSESAGLTIIKAFDEVWLDQTARADQLLYEERKWKPKAKPKLTLADLEIDL